MNKTILSGLIIFILIIGGGMAYLANSSDKNGSTAQPANITKPAASQQSPTIGTNQLAPGKYIDYNEAAFASASGTRILFFHASWCFQCREIEKGITANLDKIPAGITIFKIDYDSNQDLRRKYGVKMQTSFVKFYEQGKVIQNFVAYDEPNFANLEKNVF